MAVTLQSKCDAPVLMTAQLHFQLDAHSGVPVYRQLMDQIKYYVASGTLVAGDQLPSIRELAQATTTNPTTIVKAYTELAHDQVIELRHGKGAFVSPRANVLSASEKEKAIRRIARQLAVESFQMGLFRKQVIQIVDEELNDVQGATIESMASLRSAASND